MERRRHSERPVAFLISPKKRLTRFSLASDPLKKQLNHPRLVRIALSTRVAPHFFDKRIKTDWEKIGQGEQKIATFEKNPTNADWEWKCERRVRVRCEWRRVFIKKPSSSSLRRHRAHSRRGQKTENRESSPPESLCVCLWREKGC